MDWVKRLLTEHDDLCGKIERLRKFMDTTDPKTIRGFDLLLMQLNAMQSYENILRARLRFLDVACKDE